MTTCWPPRCWPRPPPSLYAAERRAILELRNEGTISNDVMHLIERELDLEESSLEVEVRMVPPNRP